MKYFFGLSLFIMLFVFSCQQKQEASLSELKYEVVAIPEVFENEPIIANHLRDLSENLSAFSAIMEDLADNIEEIGIKPGEKPSLRQRLQLMRVMLPKTQPIMEIISNVQQLDNTTKAIKDTLPEYKLQAFYEFEEAYNEKFERLHERFKSYIEEEKP